MNPGIPNFPLAPPHIIQLELPSPILQNVGIFPISRAFSLVSLKDRVMSRITEGILFTVLSRLLDPKVCELRCIAKVFTFFPPFSLWFNYELV